MKPQKVTYLVLAALLVLLAVTQLAPPCLRRRQVAAETKPAVIVKNAFTTKNAVTVAAHAPTEAPAAVKKNDAKPPVSATVPSPGADRKPGAQTPVAAETAPVSTPPLLAAAPSPGPDVDALKAEISHLQADLDAARRSLDAATQSAAAARADADGANRALADLRNAHARLQAENSLLTGFKDASDRETQEIERARRLTFILNP